VQTTGAAYRLKADRLRNAFAEAGQMMRTLLLYTQAFITQISQTAVCNRRHTIEQQLSRWLLQTIDRSCSNELVTTQELIAGMLGVRREGVTEAAQRLQGEGLIQYRRGHISVVDRSRLENYSCECYKVVRREFARLFSDFDIASAHASFDKPVPQRVHADQWDPIANVHGNIHESLIAKQKMDVKKAGAKISHTRRF
jgi:hypothetical protein